MPIPWGYLAIPLLGMLGAIGLFCGARGLAHVPGPSVDPYREFVTAKRRSPSRYDRLQAMIVAFAVRLDSADVESAAAATFVVRMIAACIFLVFAAILTFMLFMSLSWIDPSQNARAQETFDLARASAPAGSFDDAVASQILSARERSGYQVRNVQFEPRTVERACYGDSGSCAPTSPDRPEQAWLGDLSWEEFKPGWSHWLARTCHPKVLLTEGHHWAFDITRPCMVFI